jgi:serine/threonine protein phosphatase PrpC
VTLLRSGSATDTGLVRSVNQDLAVETGTLFAVADGMGGHAGGEVAARLAVDTLTVAFGAKPTGAGLSEAVSEANRVVFEHSLDNPDLRGMGTTMTAAALVNEDGKDVIALVNVGDSRSYRFHDGQLAQITVDHSLAEEMVRSGEISEAEAEVHPHRHILTRALGVSDDVVVDIWRIQPSRGDRFLLCSDGLTNELESPQITEVLATVPDPQIAADLQEIPLLQLGPLLDAHGIHPRAVGRPQVLDPQVTVEAEQAGVEVGGVGVVVDGYAAARRPAHGDLLADVVDPSGLVVGPDDVELHGPAALAVDHRVDVLAAAALAFERPDLHPDGADDPHEEQPEQEDDAELQCPEHRGVVDRDGGGDSCHEECCHVRGPELTRSRTGARWFRSRPGRHRTGPARGWWPR